MTDYENMEAGPEMDDLIATEVMCLETCGRQNYRDADGRLWDLPHYSEEIAAAWQVVEKMECDLGPFMEISLTFGKWRAGFFHRGQLESGGKLTWGFAPTAPLAICRAALKAVDGDSHG